MADPHEGEDGCGGRLVTPGLTGDDDGGDEVGKSCCGMEAVVCHGGNLPPSEQPASSMGDSSDSMEEGRKLREADQRVARSEPERTGQVTSPIISADHGMHASCDLEESRALQIEDRQLSTTVEISRAISTMVGSGPIDRHFVTWEKIDSILASIPGARATTTNTTPAKLKVRDVRKIHIQETLNISPSSLPNSAKRSKPKISPKTAQHLITFSKLPNEPKNARPSRPNKPKYSSKPSSKIPEPTPEPTPEWMAMMDRSIIQEPGQEGSSRGAKSEASRLPVKDTRSMADVLKGAQTSHGPVNLDASKVKQRGTASQEGGIPCLHIPDSDNTELAGRMGLALIGKFSHSIPAPHFIRKALSNFKLKGTLSWNFINAKHILITLSEIDDYVKVLCGASNNNIWFVEHHPMRMFKWTPDFDLFFETPIAPVWCNLHALPIHLFEESMLFSIGKLFGEPIQIDHNTATRARLSHARICIEIDISKPPPEKYMLRIGGKDVSLQVKWEKIPQYCSACKHVGHSEEHCYAFGKKPAPPKKDFNRPNPQKQYEERAFQGGQPQGPGPQRQYEVRREQGGQPRGDRREQGGQLRGKQTNDQTGAYSGWNRVGKKGTYYREVEQDKGKQETRLEDIEKELQRARSQMATGRIECIPSSSLQIGESLLVPNSGMTDQHTYVMGKKKKRRSPESRSRYRENRRLRRLKEIEGCAVSETEGSEFETDDEGKTQGRTRSLSPTFRGSRTADFEDTTGLEVHSNRFEILEDEDDLEKESAMAMILHDGTADAQIIHEARMTQGVRNGAASSGSSPMEIASNGDRHPAIEAPVKKARVSTSRTA